MVVIQYHHPNPVINLNNMNDGSSRYYVSPNMTQYEVNNFILDVFILSKSINLNPLSQKFYIKLLVYRKWIRDRGRS